MADYYLKSGNNADWAATTVKSVGDRVVASRVATAARKVRVYECTTGGTTGGSEPAWNSTVGGTTTDGTVTWTTREPTMWANAHRYLDHMTHTAAAGSVVAGDRVFVSNGHSESFTGNSLLTENIATKDNPYYVLCVSDDTTEPPTTLATGASIGCTGTYSLRGHSAYFYGIELRCGVGSAVTTAIRLDGQGNATTWLRFEQSVLDIGASAGGATSVLTGEPVGPGAAGRTQEVYFVNVEIQFGGTSAALLQIQSGGFTWLGGFVTAGASTPVSLIGIPNGSARKVLISGVDFSAINATNLLGMGVGSGHYADDITLIACKLSSATQISAQPAGTNVVIRVINCSSGTENYKYKSRNYYGDVDHEATLVRTGGASDGTTPLSWKVVTTANARRVQPLYTPWMFLWNDAIGSAKTVTVEILHDSATALKDNEVWLEVLELGSSAAPQATLVRDASDVLAAGADQTSSAATWTTTGMGNPNTQKLAVTFTPQMKGLFRARVAVGKASKTLYVDPLLVVA